MSIEYYRNQNPSIIPKLIESFFITGINPSKLENIQNPLKENLQPEILVLYPQEAKLNNCLELIYPSKYKILDQSSEEDNVTFFSTILTNEQASHSYIYVLNLYERYGNYKVPISVCFHSFVNDTEGFKALLNEVYLIITSDVSFSSKKLELTNYFMFVQSIVIPPFHTLLTLKCHYVSADFYFHSKCEIPSTMNDTSISILFSVLDVGEIIKLWVNVLREKHIIIFGNKPYLLTSVIDAISKLIFPFYWPHSYITCLPYNKLELLELPCPYIFGVLSSLITIDELLKKYGDALIVDLETGHFYGKEEESLPREDEIILRKQIQFVKNPELFEENELFKDEKSKILNQDFINSNLSFSENIQRIFFNVIKSVFKDFTKYIFSNNLEKKKFLSTLKNPIKEKFWGSLLSSSIIDTFIQNEVKVEENDRYYSFNKIFKNLCKENKEYKNITNALKIVLSLPQIDIKQVNNYLIEMGCKDYGELKDILIKYNKEIVKSDEKIIISENININNDNNSNSNNNNTIGIIRKKSKENYISCSRGNDFDINKDNLSNQRLRHSLTLVNKEKEIKSPLTLKIEDLNLSHLISSFKEANYTNKLPTNLSSINLCDIKDSEFIFNDEEKGNGFIQFMKKYSLNFLFMKYNFMECLFRKNFLKEILKQVNIIIESLPLSNEIKEENENDEREIQSPLQNKKSSNSKIKINRNFASFNFNSTKSEEPFQLIKFTNDNDNKMQKFLFYAYYLIFTFTEEKNSFPNIDCNQLMKNALILFHKAIDFNQVDFPFFQYAFLITNLNKNIIESLRLDIQKIPKKLQGIFNELIENSYRDMRVSHKMGSFKLRKTSSNEYKYKLFTLSMVDDNVDRINSNLNNSSFHFSSNKKNNSPNRKIDTNRIVDYAKISSQLKKEIKEKTQKHRMLRSFGDRSNISDTDSFNTSSSNNNNNIGDFSVKIKSEIYLYYNFKEKMIINSKKNKKRLPQEAMSSIIDICNKVLSLIKKLSNDNIALDEVKNIDDYIDEMSYIKEKVDNLKNVNLMKLENKKEQFAFWLNAFNFLLIYSILITGFHPKTFIDWDLIMRNGKYNIGGYELTLYEIVIQILGCNNFYKEKFELNVFIPKFEIKENNILVVFALNFPIKSNLFDLKIYQGNSFEEQLYKTSKSFFQRNIRYVPMKSKIVCSKYLDIILPQFVNDCYKFYESYLSIEMFNCLLKKQFQKVEYEETNWELYLNVK